MRVPSSTRRRHGIEDFEFGNKLSESVASHSAAIVWAIRDDLARGRHRRRRRRSHVGPSSAAFEVLFGNAAEDGRLVIPGCHQKYRV